MKNTFGNTDDVDWYCVYLFWEKTKWSSGTAKGKWLKPRYPVRNDNVTDVSLNFIKNLLIYKRSTRLYVAAIFQSMHKNG